MSKSAPGIYSHPQDYDFFFIVGAPRSGTTLLSSMLNAHSEIAIPYESNFMVHCYNKYGLSPDLYNDSTLESLIEEILSGYFVSKWEPSITKEDLNYNNCRDLPSLINEIYHCYARKKGKSIWGDKTPGYTKDIYVLNRIFPNAKYIHIIRDGRDVALSLLSKIWGPRSFPIAIRFWREVVSLCQVQLAMISEERYVELRFEDLVKHPESNLKRICSMLGVEFQSEMLSDYSSEWRTLPDAVKAIHKNVQEGPSEEECFKWKSRLSRPDQAIAYEIAGDLFHRHGYDTSIKNHRFKLVKKVYHQVVEFITWRLDLFRRNQ